MFLSPPHCCLPRGEIRTVVCKNSKCNATCMDQKKRVGEGGGVLRDMSPINLGIPLESGQFVFVIVNLLKMSGH